MAAKISKTVADVAAELSAPFQDEEIELVEKDDVELSNVKPHYYIERLIDSGAAYSIYSSLPTFVHDKHALVAIAANTKIAVDFGDGVIRNFEGVGAEDIDDRSIANTIKSAATDSFKRACIFFGLGLDLYKKEVRYLKDRDDNKDDKPARRSQRSERANEREEKQPEEEERPRSRTTSSSRGGSRGGSSRFDRDATFGGKGKLAEKTWREMDGSTLQWMADTFDKGSKNHTNALAEIDARGDDFDPNEGAKKPQGGSRGGRRNNSRASNDNWD